MARVVTSVEERTVDGLAWKEKEAALRQLDAAAGQSSYDNMLEAYPDIADAIEGAIGAGATAEDVYRTLRVNHDVDFCRWARTVARYLEAKVR